MRTLQRQLPALLTALLTCWVVMLVVTCQVHVLPHSHAHAAPTEHHDSGDDTAPHPLPDFSCLAAVLPFWGGLPFLLLTLFYVLPWVVQATTPTFPFFVPPRCV